MPFVSHDPPEFLDPNWMREVMVFHESGHLFLLFFYGWQIGGFTCRQAGMDWMGSIRNRRIPDAPIRDTAGNLENEARKLLAGELAARIRLGLPTNQIVFPLNAPPAETLTAETLLADLYPPADQRYDGIRVLARYGHNRGHLAESWWARTKLFCCRRSRITWWTWIWDRDIEAHAILKQHWPTVQALAAKLTKVNPVHVDAATGHMVGQASSDQLINWCNEVEVPVLDTAVTSTSY